MNGNARSSLIALVGAYMLYTAYDLFKGLNQESSMPKGLQIGFIVFFAIAGLAVIVYAAILWKKTRDNKEEEKKENDQEMK